MSSSDFTASITDSYDAVFFDYVITNGSSMRVGIVMAGHIGTIITYTETTTTDIGNTDGVELSVVINSNEIQLLATTNSDNWIIKSFVRGI